MALIKCSEYEQVKSNQTKSCQVHMKLITFSENLKYIKNSVIIASCIKRISLRITAIIICIFSVINLFAYGSAKINYVWLEHNITQNGESGLMVHVDINTSGLKGNKIEAIAYFYDKDKNQLLGGISGYRAKDGQVCASSNGTATYDESKWKDFKIFIPYRALPLASGTHLYYVIVDVKDVTQNKMMTNNWNYISFTGTRNSQKNQNNYANNLNPSNERKQSGKIWREELGFGSFAINEEGADGKRARMLYTQCSVCRTTGRCPNCAGTTRCGLCFGQGFTYIGGGEYFPCVMCHKTGGCTTCNKTGKCVCSNSKYPGYILSMTTIFDSDGNIINNLSFVTPSSSNPKGENSNNHKNNTICKSCGGTGISKVPVHGSNSWAGYFHSAGSRCPHCGRYDSHMHDRCESCNVPKY